MKANSRSTPPGSKTPVRCTRAAVGLAAVASLLAAGCDSDRPAETGVSARSGAAPISIVPAPKWVRTYCAGVERRAPKRILCPGRVPARLSTTVNLGVLRPSASGYIFEGDTSVHWVFGAFDSPRAIDDLGPPRELGRTVLRRRPARWLHAPKTGGIFAGHLLLAWEETGWLYVLSVHTDDPNSGRLRAALVGIGRGMRRYG